MRRQGFSGKVSCDGFTLVELLVVIAIVAILGVVLFPVFVQSRERAGPDPCESNLKRIAQATLAYAQDYDKKLPPFLSKNEDQPGPCVTFVDLLKPYLKDTQVWICPSSAGNNSDPQRIAQIANNPRSSYGGVTALDDGKIHYGVFKAYGNTPVSATMPASRALSRIPRPAELTMWVDTDGYLAHAFYFWPGDYRSITKPRHNGGANCAFVDGHVKWFPCEERGAFGGKMRYCPIPENMFRWTD